MELSDAIARLKIPEDVVRVDVKIFKPNTCGGSFFIDESLHGILLGVFQTQQVVSLSRTHPSKDGYGTVMCSESALATVCVMLIGIRREPEIKKLTDELGDARQRQSECERSYQELFNELSELKRSKSELQASYESREKECVDMNKRALERDAKLEAALADLTKLKAEIGAGKFNEVLGLK